MGVFFFLFAFKPPVFHLRKRMSKNPTKDILAKTLNQAKLLGADEAEAVFYEADGISVTVRLGELETVERPAEKALGLRVYCGKKTTSLSTSDLSPAALKELAEKAVMIAKKSPENPYAELAGKGLFTKDFNKSLEIYDLSSPEAGALKDLALQAEDAGRAVKGITNSEGGSAGWKKSTKTHLTSKGFEGENTSSSFSCYTVLLAGEGTAMERDFEFSSARYFEDLDNPEDIGRRAGERAIKRLNPKKIKSQTVPVIFHRRTSNGLLGHFSGAINGKPVAKGTTFLSTNLENQIFPKNVQIIDDPTRKRGLSSRPFDGEGLKMERLDLVQNGVLKNWLLDISSAKELELTSNGRASRSLAGSASPSSSNLYMENGKRSLEEMMAGVGEGFLVTELIGMGVNIVTGDYSRGATGFWFEGGEIAYPVSEITIAGNLKDMFSGIEPASDLEFKYGTDAPSLLIPSMVIAGT